MHLLWGDAQPMGECLGLCDEPPIVPWVTGGRRRGVPQAEGSLPGSRGECWGLLELSSETFGLHR